MKELWPLEENKYIFLLASVASHTLVMQIEISVYGVYIPSYVTGHAH